MRIEIKEDGVSVKDILYRIGVSRLLITKLKTDERGILVNGEHVTVRKILKRGDLLELAIEDDAEDTNELLVPRELPLDIIYEDDDIIALNKSADMPTHPSHGHFEDTLANALAFYFEKQGIPFVFRAVNRLDRNTSGLVLCAKNRLAASELSRLLQSGRIHKSYIAILNGSPTPLSGSIDAPIRRLTESVILRGVCDISEPGAKRALTSYETLLTVGGCSSDTDSVGTISVVRAEPITGRTHQLRVHFAHLGTPIVGDGLYGSAEIAPTCADRLITRHALHACSLVIERDGGTLTLEAPLAADMRELIEKLKGNTATEYKRR